MLRSPRLSLSLLLVAGCASTPASPTRAPAGPAFALVWRDAPLFERVDGPPLARLMAPLPKRSAEPRLLFPVRVLEAAGDYVQVEAAADDAQCVYTAAPFAALALRFLVRKADLAPVTAREATAAFPDGTGFVLQPGVPLEPKQTAAGPMYAFRALDLWFVAPLPASVVGTTYAPPRILKAPDHPPTVVKHGTTLTYGGSGRAGPLKYAENASESVPAGEAARVVLQARCATLQVLVRNEDLAAPGGGLGLFGAGGLPTSPLAKVRAGAPAFWRDGGEAGVARKETVFAGAGVVEGGKRCLQAAALWLGDTPSWVKTPPPPETLLTVCFKPEDVAVTEATPKVPPPAEEPK